MTINMSSCILPTHLNCPMGKSCKSGCAYRGIIVVPVAPIVPAAGGPVVSPSIPDGGNINDERIGTHFVLYPQPFASGGMELG
jgi:hypothetical protein